MQWEIKVENKLLFYVVKVRGHPGHRSLSLESSESQLNWFLVVEDGSKASKVSLLRSLLFLRDTPMKQTKSLFFH